MSFPRYPSYKESGVEWLGQVPEHWMVKPLRRLVAETNAGEVIDRSHWGGSSEILYTCALNPLECDFEGFPAWKRTTPNDLLLTRNGTPYVHKPVENAIYTNVVQRIQLIGGENRDYVATALQNSADNLKGYGVSIESLNYDMWKALPLLIPPLAEQEAISAFLDRETGKIDALVAEQRRLMELLKEKRQAVISHAVTRGLNPQAKLKSSGIEWLGDVPKHWEVGKLSRLISTRKGIAFKAEDFTDEGVPVVKASDIKGLTIRRSETCLPTSFLEQYPKAQLKTGDLVLSTVGSTPEVRNSAVGQLGMVPEALSESLLNQNTVVFTPSSMTLMNDFLFLILQTVGYRDHLDLHAHGTANQASINVSDMLDFFVPLPGLAEQEEIAGFISEELAKFDTLTAEAQRAIDLLQERRTALISAAVTGQIDVRGLAPITLPAPRLHPHPPLHGRVPGAEEMQAFWRGADPADLPENPAVVVVMDWLSRMADVRGFESALARLGLTHDQVMDEVFQPAENGDFRPQEQAHPLVLMQCLWRIGVQKERCGYDDMSGLILSDDFCATNVFWATLRRKLLAKDCQPPLVFETVGRNFHHGLP